MRLIKPLLAPLGIALALLPLGALQADEGREHRYGQKHGLAGRGASIPRGHFPPPGECRRWNLSLPPGQQPPPVRCERLRAGAIGRNEVILHHSGAYDPYGGWREIEHAHRDSVPERILDIFEDLVRKELGVNGRRRDYR